MRPIKFRGETFCGRTIYSNGIKFNYGRPGQFIPFLLAEDWVEVKPDSLAQFVGYDVDGQEVYEGDELKAGRYGEDGRAKIFCSIDAYDFRFGARFDNYKLKK